MRYFIYTSDTKLDMLCAQIPAKLMGRLAGELRLDLKVISLTLRTNDSDETRYGKLSLVEEYLDRNSELGWMTEPTPWFRGELPLRSGVMRPWDANEGMVFFGGIEDDLLVGLIGSERHRTGNGKDPDAITSFSHLPALFELLEAQESDAPQRDAQGRHRPLYEAVGLTKSLRTPPEPCEFLARRLLCTQIESAGRPLKVVLATPLYVALLDG